MADERSGESTMLVTRAPHTTSRPPQARRLHELRPSRASRHRTAGRRTSIALAVVSSLAAGALLAPSPVSASQPSRLRACARSDAATYPVASGDGWFTIAQAAGTGMGALLHANGASADAVLFPGDVLCLPPGVAAPAPSSGAGASAGCASRYTVAAGDSWFGIAKAAGVSMGALHAANGATADTVIFPGDELCLPAGAVLPPTSAQAAAARSGGTLAAFPMQGPCWFGNTWHAPRGGDRRHEGVDLIAEEGTYVYAVADGTLTRRAWDQPGRRAGNAWYLTAPDGTYYFYAHLYDFAPGLKVGSKVRAGEIIGFVGETGSAATPHLHFEIHPGGGAAVNPYETIKAMGGCKAELRYTQPSGWVPEG